MVRFILLCLSVVLLCHSSYGQREKKFFRKDYDFIEATESFYKISTFPRTWQEAKETCEWEGGALFYPEDEGEASTVLEYLKEKQPGLNFFWIGISSLEAKGVFETVDGQSVLDVYNKWAPGEPNDAGGVENCVILTKEGLMNDEGCGNRRPYVCKKTLTSLEWNTQCNIPYTDYKYSEEFGKCYKFHLNPRNWTDAYAICNAELSYLGIIDSQAEDEFLVQMISAAPKDKVVGSYLAGAVHLGFENRDGNGWHTIKGVPLEESGFPKWVGGQPDGGDNEKCGGIFYTGELNDIGCYQRCYFICEHDIDNVGFDDRISDAV